MTASFAVAAGLADPIAVAGVRAIDAGWAIVLTAPGTKRPHWRTPTVHDATRDPGLLEAWVAETPGVGLAVNLGASGLAAIEDDGPEGLDALAALVAEHGELPPTWQIQARRGRHRLFRACDVRSRRLGPALELRARGEYVLLPPTTVQGTTRRWIAPDPRVPIADLPPWLTRPPDVPVAAATITSSAEAAQAVLEDARERLATRPSRPGTGRGTALFAAACELGRHVHAGTLDLEEAQAALQEAAEPLRLSVYERDRSIQRGLMLGPTRGGAR